MQEERVTLETGKLAKEKGFNLETEWAWQKRETEYISVHDSQYRKLKDWNKEERHVTCSQPTQSLLQKWLREIHGIEVLVMIYPESMRQRDNLPRYNAYCLDDKRNPKIPSLGTFNDSYEKAFEGGLQEALKLIP